MLSVMFYVLPSSGDIQSQKRVYAIEPFVQVHVSVILNLRDLHYINEQHLH